MKPELYVRMNNGRIFKSYIKMIKEYPEDIAKELMINLTSQALDHPKYAEVKQVYDERFGAV